MTADLFGVSTDTKGGPPRPLADRLRPARLATSSARILTGPDGAVTR